MKALKTLCFFGSQCNRRTGWQTFPGFTRADLADGSTLFLGDVPEDKALAMLHAQGVCTADYDARRAAQRAADHAAANPGPRELAAELYQHGYGYEKPATLGAWSFSTTFGRWSRLVTFADGWHGYSYPKI